MSEINRQRDPNELSKIYGKLNSQDVEQFYASYQLWQLQQQALSLEAQMEDLRREIAANAELMEMVHLPAIALATVARLQASGVKDIALLDRMVERGEEWLDRTMQRLDYCEQLDFIIDDYTQWCQNALEGAYDWIDSMREGGTPASPEAPTSEAAGEATEELLLQKLTSEEDEQASSPETPHQQTELSSSQEPASAPPELPINGEQSDAASIEALSEAKESASQSFVPQDEVGETVPDFDTTRPKEEVFPFEEQATTSEEAQDTVETQLDLEETTLELLEAQEQHLPQPVEADAAPEPLEASPVTDISNEIEQAIEEETSSNYDAMIHPAPLHALSPELSTIPDNQPSTIEASDNEHATPQVDREFDSAPEEPVHTQLTSEAEQPSSEADTLENTEQGSIRETMPHRHRNFLQRLVTKIWRG